MEPRRMACLAVPDLPLVVACAAGPDWKSLAVVVGGAPQERKPVIACSAAARQAGVRPGQTLRQAHQLCPQALFLAPDLEAQAQRFSALGERIAALTPSWEPIGMQGYFIDLTGASWGREPGRGRGGGGATGAADASEVQAETLRQQAAELGLPSQVGVASTRLLAWLAAKQPGRPYTVVQSGESAEAEFLAPLPVFWLPLSPQLRQRLHNLGLRHIGQLQELPAASLVEQFGDEGRKLARLLHPAAPSSREAPLPWTPDPPLVVSQELEPAAEDLEGLLFVTEAAARTAAARLAEMGHAARRLRVTLVDERLGRHDLACDLREPRARAEELAWGWRRLLGTLAGQVQASIPEGAVELRVVYVEFAVPLAGPAPGRQGTWLAPDGLEKTEAALERLVARWGPDRVWRATLSAPEAIMPEAALSWDDGSSVLKLEVETLAPRGGARRQAIRR